MTLGDLKAPPALWHEDFGRKPWENGRYDILIEMLAFFSLFLACTFSHTHIFCAFYIYNLFPSIYTFNFCRQNSHGNVSGRQLGEAAHRFVANSLQGRDAHQMHASYNRRPYYPAPSNPRSHGFHDRPHQRMPSPGAVNPQVKNHSNYSSNPRHGDRNHGEQHPLSPDHPHSRPHSQHYERNSRSSSHNSGQHNMRDEYASGIHQNVMPMYPHGPRAQTPRGFNTRPYPGGHNHYQNNQPAGAFGYPWAGGWVPPANQGFARGYVPSQQPGNQYSALDRRPNGRHQPPPGYGRQ